MTRNIRGEDKDRDEYNEQLTGYLEGARRRTQRFAEGTSDKRAASQEIEALSSTIEDRPTGILSGGDADIAYHYLGLGIGILAMLYSTLGTVFAFSGGGARVVSLIASRSASGFGLAVSNLLTMQTLLAVVFQAVLFIVIIGTRCSPRSWLHGAMILSSAALTYAGWNTVWIEVTPHLAAITTAVPAALLGGALSWILLRGGWQGTVPRWLQVGAVAVGVMVAMMGDVALLTFLGVIFER